MTIQEIIKNLKLRISGDEITIQNLSHTIDENKKLAGHSSYAVAFQEGEREATIFNKECLEDLLSIIEEEEDEKDMDTNHRKD